MAEDIGATVDKEEVYSIVTTTRAKYFGKVVNNGKGVIIESAYEMKGETDAQSVAKGYIRGFLYGDNKRIELSDALIESVTDAPDETRIVKTYEALLPDAKKRAMGIMTYKALEDLLTK
ncbi:MAG: hypothetical protein ABIJ21_08350 [Nanoarchaeota archaeon]